jgi:hypothetical protein
MDRFIAIHNIEHLRKQLAEELDEAKRKVLSRLLAEEEKKLAVITANRQKSKSEKGR